MNSELDTDTMDEFDKKVGDAAFRLVKILNKRFVYGRRTGRTVEYECFQFPSKV